MDVSVQLQGSYSAHRHFAISNILCIGVLIEVRCNVIKRDILKVFATQQLKRFNFLFLGSLQGPSWPFKALHGLWGAFMGIWGAFDCSGVLIKVVDHLPFIVLVVSCMFCNTTSQKIHSLCVLGPGGPSWAYRGPSDSLRVLIKVRDHCFITF